MRRLIIVYNPRSSRARLVRKEVLTQATQLPGVMVGKYEVQKTDVDDNAKRLARLLQDGDLVVTAGGDGTAEIGINGCMLSKKDVTIGVLGYGNFNDVARAFGAKNLQAIVQGKAREVWLLEAVVDGQHLRYGAGYFTIGLFAESVRVFDEKGTRKQLRTGKKSVVFSILTLARWYFKNKRREFLPEFKLNGRPVRRKTTDYLAVNSRTVAKLMRGGRYYLGKKFLSGTGRLRSFWRLLGFMFRSMVRRVPGAETRRDVLEFAEPSTVEIHTEGEYKTLEKVQKIEIKKAERPLKVVLFN